MRAPRQTQNLIGWCAQFIRKSCSSQRSRLSKSILVPGILRLSSFVFRLPLSKKWSLSCTIVYFPHHQSRSTCNRPSTSCYSAHSILLSGQVSWTTSLALAKSSLAQTVKHRHSWSAKFPFDRRRWREARKENLFAPVARPLPWPSERNPRASPSRAAKFRHFQWAIRCHSLMCRHGAVLWKTNFMHFWRAWTIHFSRVRRRPRKNEPFVILRFHNVDRTGSWISGHLRSRCLSLCPRGKIQVLLGCINIHPVYSLLCFKRRNQRNRLLAYARLTRCYFEKSMSRLSLKQSTCSLKRKRKGEKAWRRDLHKW